MLRGISEKKKTDLGTLPKVVRKWLGLCEKYSLTPVVLSMALELKLNGSELEQRLTDWENEHGGMFPLVGYIECWYREEVGKKPPVVAERVENQLIAAAKMDRCARKTQRSNIGVPPQQRALEWTRLRDQFKLSHAVIQMARELGLNTKELRAFIKRFKNKRAARLTKMIEARFRNRFGMVLPDAASLEEQLEAKKRNEHPSQNSVIWEERMAARVSKRAA